MAEKRPVGFFFLVTVKFLRYTSHERDYTEYIYFMFLSFWKSLSFYYISFLLFWIKHAVSWDILIWFPVAALVLSLVSLQFLCNCFHNTDTRILKFYHFGLLNIAVFFSFLLFSGSELSLLSSRMVKSWPINPKSPQWSDKNLSSFCLLSC